jgi:hypothetical protein
MVTVAFFIARKIIFPAPAWGKFPALRARYGPRLPPESTLLDKAASDMLKANYFIIKSSLSQQQVKTDQW